MAADFRSNTNYPRGLRNNNPGDLRTGDQWQGMVGEDAAGFVIFQDITWGVRAMVKVLLHKMNHGLTTIAMIITDWAPPSENDTQSYIDNVSSDTGIDPNATLSTDSSTLHSLTRAIMNQELGDNYSAMITDEDIDTGIGLVNNPVQSVVQATPIAVNNVVKDNPSGTAIVILVGIGLVAWLLAKK